MKGTLQEKMQENPALEVIVPPTSDINKKLKRKHSERFKRMMKVKHLHFVNKWSYSEIAEALGINKGTVYRDVQIIRETNTEKASSDIAFQADVRMFFWELKDRYEARVKRLWNDYNLDSTKSKLRVAILKELRDQEKQFIETLQDVGILRKVATKIEVDKQSKEVKVMYNMTEKELKHKLQSLIDDDVSANPVVENASETVEAEKIDVVFSDDEKKDLERPVD